MTAPKPVRAPSVRLPRPSVAAMDAVLVASLYGPTPAHVRRLQTALVVSILLHALVLLGVHFKGLDPQKLLSRQSLEVILVNSKSDQRPLDTKVRAQANLDGGGNTDEDRRLKTPFPTSSHDPSTAIPPPEAERVAKLEAETNRLLTQLHARQSVPVKELQPRTEGDADPDPMAVATPRPTAAAEPHPPLPDAATLMSRSLEIARLEAQIAKDHDEYQKRPRRKFIGARAQEYAFARYEDDYRAKVEHVGTVNYPPPENGQPLRGSVQLTVSIRSNGSVEHIQIERSSGNHTLDAAARRIVEMASPFPAFTDAMLKEADILAITRTFTFTRVGEEVRAE